MIKYEIKKVGVIGLGLIGASILKDIKNHRPDISRYGFSKGREMVVAEKHKLINKGELNELVNDCDLIIIATPIADVVKISDQIIELKNSRKKLLVTDVASVKSEISEHFNVLNKKQKTSFFISSHPMGGSEKAGYDNSRGGLFRQKPWIICAKEDQNTFVIEFSKLIKECCGPKIVYLNPELHDIHVAAISHFVLDLSSVLFDFVSKKHPEALTIAGDSFITTTRLASDNPRMLSAINQNNFENIEPIAIEFIEHLKNTISDKNLDRDYFTKNKRARDSWLHHRNMNKR